MAKLTLETPHLGLFVARRNSGKTHLMRYLLHVLAREQRFDFVHVINPTSFNGEWSSIVGPDGVTNQFDEDTVFHLLDQLADLCAADAMVQGLLILDDCLGAGCNFGSDLWTRIATAGRHYGLTVWISAQHLYKLPPVVRNNSDYMFLLGVQSEKVSKELHESFGGVGFNNRQSYAHGYWERPKITVLP